MKLMSILTLMVLSYSGAQAQQAVVGSCTPSTLGKDWSQCDFTSGADPHSTFHSNAPNCTLSCYDYANYESNPNCQYPPKVAQCILSNPSFAGACPEHIEYFGGTTPEQACGEIRDYLNKDTSAAQDGCLKTYCSNTSIRRNWTLKSAN